MHNFELTADERSLLRSVVLGYNQRFFALIRFLSIQQRDAVLVVYAWVFQAHEILDIPDGNAVKTLSAYRSELEKVWDGGETKHLITLLFVRLARSCDIEKRDCLEFLHSLESIHTRTQTTTRTLFSSRQELERWLASSSKSVGEFFALALELPPSGVRLFRELGGWMGMIGLLRNVGRDWRISHRVLLPSSLLAQYELTAEQLWDARSTWHWHELVYDESQRLLVDRREIESALSPLPKRVQAIVRILLELETWVLLRLRKYPVLCWNITVVRPSMNYFLRMLAWQGWKRKALPLLKKGLKNTQSALSKGKVVGQAVGKSLGRNFGKTLARRG